MNFVHSVYFKDAESQWNRRKERINLENFFVKLGIDADDENRDAYLSIFSNVPHKKICFYSGETETDGGLYLRRFEKYVKTGARMETIKYTDYCRKLDWLLKSIDILKLLNGETEFLRED